MRPAACGSTNVLTLSSVVVPKSLKIRASKLYSGARDAANSRTTAARIAPTLALDFTRSVLPGSYIEGITILTI